MTIAEMHRQVNLGLQSIDAERFDDFLPEEIDIALNNAQLRWVKQVYDNISPEKPDGFEVNEKRIAQLSSLVTYTLPISTLTVKQFEVKSDVLYVRQPSNLLYQVGTLFKFNHLESKADLSKTFEGPQSKTIVKLDVENFFSQISNLDNVQITVTSGASSVDIITSSIPTSIDVSEKEIFIGWLLSQLSEDNKYKHLNTTAEIYYESFADQFISKGLIFVVPSTVTSITISNGIVSEVATAASLTNTSDYTISTNSDTSSDNTGKFYTHDDIEDALRHSFKKPSLEYKRIPYTIKNRKVIIYDSPKFTTTSAILKFVRKPNIISLSLNQDCELPDYTHDEIVQMAVYELMQKTSNPGMQSQAEFLTRTE